MKFFNQISRYILLSIVLGITISFLPLQQEHFKKIASASQMPETIEFNNGTIDEKTEDNLRNGVISLKGITLKDQTKYTEKLEDNALDGDTHPIVYLLIKIIDLISLSIASFAFLMMIVGSLTLVVSGTNDGLQTKAKNIITMAIVGLIIGLLSYTITVYVSNIF